jgi:hypothetical protein
MTSRTEAPGTAQWNEPSLNEGDLSDNSVYSDLQAHKVMKELETVKQREEKEKRSLDEGRDAL